MSVLLDICNLDGQSQIFEFQRKGVIVGKILRNVVLKHDGFKNDTKLDYDLIDWDRSKLIYNSKSLDNKSDLANQSVEFKKGNKYTLHIIIRGGYVDFKNNDVGLSISPEDIPIYSIPINVPKSSVNLTHSNIDEIDPDGYNFSKSYPGDVEFFEKQRKTQSLREMSTNFNHLSDFLQEFSQGESPNDDRMDKILLMLERIDTKLDQLIIGTPPGNFSSIQVVNKKKHN